MKMIRGVVPLSTGSSYTVRSTGMSVCLPKEGALQRPEHNRKRGLDRKAFFLGVQFGVRNFESEERI